MDRRRTAPRQPMAILCADDDADDRLLLRDALHQSKLANPLHFVEDGEELMSYLRHQGRYTDPATSPRPGLILLDLNMPRKDGREALGEIKADPGLRTIPVIVLTTSAAEVDILHSYDVGANSYIMKPVSFEELVQVVRDLGRYWFQIVELPVGDMA
ncbi:response regulator [soil metagenome]